MASGPDDRRDDHTRPTIAFIALAVAAAAVMTAGMTGQTETPIAADRPPRMTSVAPTPKIPAPSPEALAVPDFSMADVVTLAAAEATRRPVRSTPHRGRADAGPDGPTTGAASSTPTAGGGGGTGSLAGSGSGGATSGSGGGSATGPRSGSGTRSGSGGSGSGPGSGSGGGTSTGSDGVGDAGPGRSTTGQGKARGQRDATPGRGGGASKAARVTGRTDSPGNDRAKGRR